MLMVFCLHVVKPMTHVTNRVTIILAKNPSTQLKQLKTSGTWYYYDHIQTGSSLIVIISSCTQRNSHNEHIIN